MKSFVYAFRGLTHTIKNERNMRVHLCIAFYVICAAFVCMISASQWAAVLICIGLVLTLECLNTALETLCDVVCPKKNEGIRIVKDVSAGAVLCAAGCSAAVGGAIFFRADKVGAALEFLSAKPIPAGAIILSVIPAAIFIFAPCKKAK